MFKFLRPRRSDGSPPLGLTQKTLARACAILFFLSLFPLVIIALYNYPADDDFSLTFHVAQVWVQTGSLWQLVKAIFEKTREIYLTWQGNFVSTALFNVIPIHFGLRWYFLSAWAILSLLCLSIGYMVKGATRSLLQANKSVFWIVYTVFITLTLQFMPSIGYSVYWHNGGMYTVAACTLFFLQGLLCRCLLPQSRPRALLRGFGAALTGFMLGGSFFGPMLGAFVLVLLETVAAFVKRSKNRPYCALALGFFLLSMAVSVCAPGNLLRQERTGETLSPLMAIVVSMKDSFEVAGSFLTPQVLGGLLLICPVLWLPLKKSRYAFAHPLGVTVMFYGLFSAALVPGVFTGFGYTTERYYNVIYFYFLLMAIASAVYAEGALIRFLERRKDYPIQISDRLGQRFTAGYLALCLGLFALGGFAYPIMNTSSISASRSLLTGQAARFREEMAQREEYILHTPEDELTIEPIADQPYVFKEDKLPWQGKYGRLLYMKWYYEMFFYADLAKENAAQGGDS